MTGMLAPSALAVPALIARSRDAVPPDRDLQPWLEGVMRSRDRFGITRVGSLTRLDRIGIPVVQVTRPLALSNAVSQGKGVDIVSAAASGVMETIETWAAERIPAHAIGMATPSSFGTEVIGLYERWALGSARDEWTSTGLPWIEGWDLLSAAPMPVPVALVDTVYTYPSPHPPLFPRVTTGLGAGACMEDAIVQAALEILERDALAQAQRTPFFFERFQVDLSGVGASGKAGSILDPIRKAGLLVGAWRVPTDHDLPVYRCHLMESEGPLELAPMPAEGSACRFTEDEALAGALLEACQARLAAIAGAREDITRRMYPSSHDRAALAEWREGLRMAGPLPHAGKSGSQSDPASRLQRVLDALARAGARAGIVVPLFSDDDLGIHVARMVAPPLRLWPGGGHG